MADDQKNTFVNVDFSNFPDGLHWLEGVADEKEEGNRSAVIRKLVRKAMQREQDLLTRRAARKLEKATA